ncbi:MAG: transposase [Clostridia bacterium]|nr:transposase [Clostridia bacterium]
MEYSYKFRLYPTKNQEKYIHKNFGCCRFVYNYFLARRKEVYEKEEKTLNYHDCCKELTELKKTYTWLKDVDSTALQSTLKDLDAGYQNFFRRIKKGEKPNYPKFKNKNNHKKSYKTKGKIRVCDNGVSVPKIGMIKCCISQQVKGRILSATISQVSSGKYYIVLCCTDVDIASKVKTGKSIGIDCSLSDFVVMSDGNTYTNLSFLSRSERKLALLQRRLSRKEKGSKNYEKARIKVAKLHEKIANQRMDMIHKQSTMLINQYDQIVTQAIDIKNLKEHTQIAKSLSDMFFGEFKRQLDYKAIWYGKTIIEVDKSFPAKQICSNCGSLLTKVVISSEYCCPDCGLVLNTQMNSAINILKKGRKIVS